MYILEVVKSKKSSILVLALIIAVVLVTTTLGATMATYGATEQYYEVRLGEETLCYVKTAEEANAIIDGVNNYYATDGSEVVSVTCEPRLTTVSRSIKVEEEELPEMTQDTGAVVDQLMTGGVEEEIYVIQPGDTLWEIATSRGMTNEEVLAMNPDLDMTTFLPGDTIRFAEAQPLITVTMESVTTIQKEIPYETTTVESDELYTDETQVQTAGVNGVATVKEQVVTINGKASSVTELERTVTAEPVTEVVLQGTKERPVETTSYSYTYQMPATGSVASGNGSAIAAYACNFVGYPYVYGGTSLTGGADCSGFVYAVFQNCGVWMPRVGQEYMGYSVPLSQAQPGDILVYYGHVSIYIGGGAEVHAVNPGMGIQVTGIGYVGPVIDVRRVVE